MCHQGGNAVAKSKRPIESYSHRDKHRVNNPPAGLVTPDTDPDGNEKRYAYDPHLDPQLQWAGKAEHTSFEVPTVSLHVHERIDPRTIIDAVRKKNGDSAAQMSLFEMLDENPPLREAIEFYKHAHGWSNRLVAGDSLLVMNSLLEKEGMAGKVQMVYIDPPYGIKYGSNFQPFVNKRDVKDGKDEDLTAEPEQIRAFRDTWELGIHSYLTYLRDRFLLARELLTESGSIFVQISDENVHHVRELMDEVFGAGNFVNLISYATSTGSTTKALARTTDFLLWYANDLALLKFRQLYGDQEEAFSPNGADDTGEYELASMTSQHPSNTRSGKLVFLGEDFFPSKGRQWSFDPEDFWKLLCANRVEKVSLRQIRWKKYRDERARGALSNRWNDTQFTGFSSDKVYAVQTVVKVIQRCLLMTTDPGDLVFDPTCGSGTTAYVAEQWGRRWITCDTSRVALTLAKQRLMTAVYDYYELAHPREGVGSGFKYKTVPHVTLKSIANNPDIREGMTREEIDAAIARHAPQETLYDQPSKDSKKTRVSGPFTVEAVPAPAVKSVEDILGSVQEPGDTSVTRSGETLRQGDWREELLRTGIRGKGGQHIRFSRLEPMPGLRHLHADGETRPSDEGAHSIHEGTAFVPQRIVVSFGPEHAPLEQRQVAQAIDEAQTLVPRPKLIAFAAFQFDPEAAKDIDETNWPGVTLLKIQMNADLLTEDLKKNRASNESFWLIGQPDVLLERMSKGDDQGKYRVVVQGFDYYNTRTGAIESGGQGQIAVWFLDTDYDGRSLYPRQVFFPQAADKEGWGKLSKNLKAEIDEELIEAYRGTESLPFAAGEHKRIAVKIVDDRGIESLKVLEVQ